MSYDLINPYTKICRKFSRQFWSKAMDLAELYGWQRLGTHAPLMHDFQKLGAEWDGNYLTNDGQIVGSEDALSLAAALEKALGDIPDAKAHIDWSANFWVEDDLPEWLTPEERGMLEDGLLDFIGTPPLEFFAGAEKHQLKQFMRFCRLGSFVVL